MGRAISKLMCGALCGALLVLFAAAPASADPARPTNYESTVTGVEPESDVVSVEVVGGDAFLRIRVRPGTEVVVLGYDDEPYLRVLADGRVEQNERSPAVLLNTDRYASVGSQPSDVDPEAEPRWQEVADGGEYAWHDHRAHWMGKTLPPQLHGEESGVVFDDWMVPLVVDGVAVTVHGRLVRDAPPSPLPWIGAAAVVAAIATIVARHTKPLTASAIALAAAAAVAIAVSAAGQYGLPAATGRQLHLVWVPVIAFAAALGGVLFRRTPSGPALVAGAALTLPLWLFGMFDVLTHAHAPTTVAEPLQRAVIATVLGVVVATALVAVLHSTRGWSRPPRPSRPPQPAPGAHHAPGPQHASGPKHASGE